MVYCSHPDCDVGASLYKLSIPKMDMEYCGECGHTRDSWTIDYDFCSMECLLDFINNTLSETKIDKEGNK